MFQEKVCVMVGTTYGVGQLLAERFAAKGCHIAFMDADKKAGIWLKTLLQEEFDTEVFFFHGDSRSEEDLEIFAAAVVEMYGRIDYLIYNGTVQRKRASSGRERVLDFSDAFQVGCIAPYILDQSFYNYFEEGGVEIYTIPDQSWFDSRNGGACRLVRESIESLTKFCAEQYKGRVRVNCVSAGERGLDELSLQEMADTICFLCEEKTDFLNGESIGALFRVKYCI